MSLAGCIYRYKKTHADMYTRERRVAVIFFFFRDERFCSLSVYYEFSARCSPCCIYEGLLIWRRVLLPSWFYSGLVAEMWICFFFFSSAYNLWLGLYNKYILCLGGKKGRLVMKLGDCYCSQRFYQFIRAKGQMQQVSSCGCGVGYIICKSSW